MLDIRLLGGLQIRLDGHPLPARAGQRKRAAVLALLAAAPQRVVARERLIGLLWPEHDAARARHQLAAAAHDLRGAIGGLLTAEGDSLGLVDVGVECDLWAFERALDARAPAQAAQIYRGALLDGFHLPGLAEFERWLSDERGRLDRQYAAALEAAAAAAAADGAADAAAEWWARRAAHDPYDSRVAIRAMQALAAAGNPAGALRHARAHASLVRADLQAEPDEAVMRLATALQARPGAVDSLPSLPAAPTTPTTGLVTRDERTGEPVVSSASATAADAGAPEPSAPPIRPSSARGPRRVVASMFGLAVAVACGGLLLLAGRLAGRHAVGARTAAADADSAVTPPLARTRVDGTSSAVARAHYLRGRMQWARRTHASLDSAVVELRRATEEDPLYAAAHGGLAQAYAMLGYFGFMPGDAAFPKARAAAQQALRLDPRDGDAHAALGQALAWEHRWAEAESVYARGTRLDPGNATLHQWYGLLEAYLGRSHAAARETGIAARLEPLSVQINNMHAMMRFEDGDTAGALRHFERTVDAEPDSAWVRQNPWVLDNYAVVAGATGRHALALHLLAHALRVVPTHPRPLLTLAQQHLRVGDTARAVAAFARADTTHPHYAVYRGLYLARLGRMDEAFASLDGVREWPLPSLVSLNNGAGNTRLRADPRYRQLRAKLGMPLR